MHIIGTAGHVDHGKSSLVRALTGTDPDRWIEEQLRGMTLDLGFAHLRLADGSQAGIIDVPGHERFLHNMLAGAAGMELLMLVVAANEGVRPQTREHLAILTYLNVRRSLIVVTKSDLLDAGDLAVAIECIRADLAGSLVERAPLVAVSSYTGAGMDDLRGAILQECSLLPARSNVAPAYLPIDRVFALAGHGTIVTGTLMQGTLHVGDQLQIAPHGGIARVRSLHVFGSALQQVEAGSRVAVNLPGIETSQLQRGDVLADLQFAPASEFEVNFTPLPQAVELLRRRNPVRAYIGSAEVLGTLVFASAPQGAGEERAMLHLRRPVITYPHANFVIRRMSPKTLLGGGVIAGIDSRASDAGVTPQTQAILGVLTASALEPLTPSQIAARANVREDSAAQTLADLAEEHRVFTLAKPLAYADASAAGRFLEAVLDSIVAKQQQTPWVLGLTSLALARELGVAEDRLMRFLAAFADDGKIASRNGYYATPDHVATLTAEQRAFFEKQLPVDSQNPYLPVPLADLVGSVRTSAIPGLSQAFDTLVTRGAIVKVGEDVYRGTQIAAIHARVDEYLRTAKQMTMAQFRDLIGTSRKFAVPLLEWFDARGITIRSGDFRMLRAKRP